MENVCTDFFFCTVYTTVTRAPLHIHIVCGPHAKRGIEHACAISVNITGTEPFAEPAEARRHAFEHILRKRCKTEKGAAEKPKVKHADKEKHFHVLLNYGLTVILHCHLWYFCSVNNLYIRLLMMTSDGK